MQLMIIDALLVQISHNRIGEKLHRFKRACLDTNTLIQKIRQKSATYCQIMAFFTESSFPDEAGPSTDGYGYEGFNCTVNIDLDG